MQVLTKPVALVALVVAVLIGPLALPSEGQTEAAAEGDAERELAEKFAPVMMLKAQDGLCDSDGEPYGPTSADIVLDNPDVLLRQLGSGNPVVMRAPGASDLFDLGEGFFLDFPGSALDPGCLYEADFGRYTADEPWVVYAHVVQQEDHPDKVVVQYWFYWYFNDWNNKHESDWEGIQLLFDASSVEEALEAEPVSVGYAQHEGGEQADWDASKLQRDGTHPFVFSSAGSHASYFGSAFYLGRSGGEGFGCDNTDGPSNRIDPDVVLLPDSVTDPDDPVAWLSFTGRWGERQPGPFNGPTGVAAKERWLNPVDWHDDLRSGSVVIPGGDSQAASVISTFCELVEAGSGLMIQFATSPTRLLLTAGLLVLFSVWLVRRTVWSVVDASPLVRRRRAGQIIRTAIGFYRGSWRNLFVMGLVYAPTALVVGLFVALLNVLPLIRDVLDLAGSDSPVGVTLAIVAGGFANVAAYVAVGALVSAYYETVSGEQGRTVADAARLAWSRRTELIHGFARASLIVFGLAITIVGIPWAIRQLVRFQFLPQAVILEDADARQGLVRASELVAGRWWHTLGMTTIFHALVAASGLAFGLILLVVFSGLPIWMFSVLSTLAYTLVAPLAAVAQTLLYGDAVAEKRGAAQAELVEAQ